MARHDPLTDLPNRTLLRESLEQRLPLVRGEQHLAVHYLDLDRFKAVNDTLGHAVGDKLLCAVGIRLRSCLQESGMVARLGGDEFAILQIGHLNDLETSALAERILEAISQPFEIDGHMVAIGTSIGISRARPNDTDGDTLLRQADLALYKAKTDGKGIYRYFEPGMDAALQLRRELELGLRRAIQMDEFELNYQPLVDISSGEITACEALIRWNHPDRGCISPADFIPLAEENGMINAIGRWVIEKACSDAASWPPHVRVAVNVSAIQFKSAGLVESVKLALRKANLPANRLEIEITESLLLLDNETTFETLHELRRSGVRIAMDDFGTGCSSLSYLRSFPFDKIKIDRSFVAEMCSSIDSKAIVRAVAGLGHTLGIPVTAEGVETQEQLDHLRSEGCTEAQGYLFSRPETAFNIARFLSSRPARAA
jgi:diguanylate cyclase (GGDEF)-like protein